MSAPVGQIAIGIPVAVSLAATILVALCIIVAVIFRRKGHIKEEKNSEYVKKQLC